MTATAAAATEEDHAVRVVLQAVVLPLLRAESHAVLVEITSMLSAGLVLLALLLAPRLFKRLKRLSELRDLLALGMLWLLDAAPMGDAADMLLLALQSLAGFSMVACTRCSCLPRCPRPPRARWPLVCRC